MDYNSQRPDIIIPEYGRHVQKMVQFLTTVEDRDERNKIAGAVIKVMGQLAPHLRDIEDFNHKLWDHLHIISDFKLDVDSPYPVPSQETLQEKPERVGYPQDKIRYGHYGKILESLIKKASEMEDGEERQTLTHIIANLMKRQYLTWNRNTVNDELIKDQLKEMSNGVLELQDGQELTPTNEIVIATQQKKKSKIIKKGKKKRN